MSRLRKLHGDEADICSKYPKSGGEVRGGIRPRLTGIGRERPLNPIGGVPECSLL
jgi:hypothetical protein